MRDRSGSYESIKQVLSVSPSGVRFSYSASHPDRISKLLYRLDIASDARSARTYDPTFDPRDPNEMRPGSTNLGISRDLLEQLKANGSTDASIHAIHDNQVLAGRFAVERDDICIPIVLDDREAELPAIQLRGDFGRLSGRFWFLDQTDAPLALMYHIDEAVTPAFAERQELRVTSVTTPDVLRQIPEQLIANGQVDVHDIYFDFDKAELRPESKLVLDVIADTLKAQPTWHIVISGHTDNVGSKSYNDDLSIRRAAAVEQELVRQYGIGSKRLTIAGYGASHPIADNATVEGRVLNRRVEFTRR